MPHLLNHIVGIYIKMEVLANGIVVSLQWFILEIGVTMGKNNNIITYETKLGESNFLQH